MRGSEVQRRKSQEWQGEVQLKAAARARCSSLKWSVHGTERRRVTRGEAVLMRVILRR